MTFKRPGALAIYIYFLVQRNQVENHYNISFIYSSFRVIYFSYPCTGIRNRKREKEGDLREMEVKPLPVHKREIIIHLLLVPDCICGHTPAATETVCKGACKH